MSNQRRHPNVVNQDELEPTEMVKGKHHALNRRMGAAAGGQQLGATLTELPPGARSFPFHFHCINEEAVYVVAGTGTVRIGETRIPIRAGDWIALPVGPDHAHQMINDGAVPLTYLCVSTSHKAEIVCYPDSKKVAASAGMAFDKPWIRQIVKQAPSLDYWQDEPDAQ